MTRILVLTTASVVCLAAACFLYRTDRLPRFLHRNIDMLAIAIGVFTATPISIAAWQWFSPVPHNSLSWGMAAYIAFNTTMQFIGIQLTRVAFGLPTRTRA